MGTAMRWLVGARLGVLAVDLAAVRCLDLPRVLLGRRPIFGTLLETGLIDHRPFLGTRAA